MARLPDPNAHVRWSRLIQQHEQSDLTIADFCSLHGFSTASFYHWRRKIRSQASAQREFLAVEVSDPNTSNRNVIPSRLDSRPPPKATRRAQHSPRA
ncbi:IS66 family insertion sequence element accessory protein TnpA [Rhodopirellula sp. JC639]|uniref:IS66 family insertion sequence element accessory protein TnpA n=1 Tax=Stieleria mannarensis TaxID=2755585 RepID=UPI00336AE660